MRPSENRKIKEPELEPVFVAGPDAFTDDYTDIFVMFFLSVRLPSNPPFLAWFSYATTPVNP